MVVKTPVDSTTTSTPALPHGMHFGLEINITITLNYENSQDYFKLENLWNLLSFLEDLDLVSIDNEASSFSLDFTLVLSMSRIIFEHVDHVVQGKERVIDGQDLQETNFQGKIPCTTIQPRWRYDVLTMAWYDTWTVTTPETGFVKINTDLSSFVNGSSQDQATDAAKSIDSDFRHGGLDSEKLKPSPVFNL